MNRRFLIGLAANVTVPFLCLGEETTSAAATVTSSGSMLLALVRMFGALLLVLAIFLGGLWVFRNSQRLACRQGRSAKLSVLEIKSLGQRHTLFVVGYEQQRMLLAASPAGVTLLTPLPAAERSDEPAVQQAGASSIRDFPALLMQALGGRS